MLNTYGLTDAETQALHEDYLHLHRNPELSMQEHNTAAFIESKLSELGIEHFRCGGTGVVGILRNGEGPVVAFRADSDGLPIAEEGVRPSGYRCLAAPRLPGGGVLSHLYAGRLDMP
ncbi:hypothetical protein GCM10017709_34160 [Glutamicibacter nicotianae]